MNYKKMFLALIFSYAIINAAKCQESVKIAYLGTIYKPIESLIVSKVKIPDTALFTRYLILNENDFYRFRDTISAYLPKNYKRGDSQFGCFIVTFDTGDKIKAYFLPNSRISIRYFKKLITALKKAEFSNEITEVIQMYLTRIGG